MAKIIHSGLASSPEHYDRFNMKKEIAVWEDSLRTSGRKGEYEWWYFDFKLEDGSTLVIVFYTTVFTATKAGFLPNLSFSLTRPDGTKVEEKWTPPPEKVSFSIEKCDIVMGDCTVQGDLHSYKIHLRVGRVTADVELTGNINAWRPGAGYIYFGDEDYFAWLPSVPEGSAKVSLMVDGRSETLSGTGYHDHNWGNIQMYHLMHHWYWGRAKIGDYQVISCYITGGKKYGHAHYPVFMLAKNGNLIGDDIRYLTYSQKNVAYDSVTRKHYYQTLAYDYNDGKQHYRITYMVKDLIEQTEMMGDAAKKFPTNLILKIAKIDAGYLRFTGTARIEKLEGSVVVEQAEAPATWEMTEFGVDADV
ncbi:MAG: hypothetical protein LUG45_08850 [Clostridiales bacterium]|nr:hypothetical protein [Clostridiales bacterium]